jgi:hypothetical protein
LLVGGKPFKCSVQALDIRVIGGAQSARFYISRATPLEENSIGVEIARTDGLVARHPAPDK